MLDVRGDIFFYRLVSTVTVFLPSNFIKAAPTENNYKYLNDYNEFENQITFNENADSYQRWIPTSNGQSKLKHTRETIDAWLNLKKKTHFQSTARSQYL